MESGWDCQPPIGWIQARQKASQTEARTGKTVYHALETWEIVNYYHHPDNGFALAGGKGFAKDDMVLRTTPISQAHRS